MEEIFMQTQKRRKNASDVRRLEYHKSKTLVSVHLWNFFFDGPKLVRFWPKILYFVNIHKKPGWYNLGMILEILFQD